MADEDLKPDAVDPDVQRGDTTTTTAPTKKPAPPKREPRKLPPYKVLLHNDDLNTFDHVIRSVVRLTPIPEHDAVVKAIEAHETGVALLLVTHRERAELYAEQFASLSITVTIESDEA
jgi:ATP-dependent Clp protease adaptor protein ClpS